ncbi:MAG: adenylyltransferase/cytidyltransferase family protein [Muribaculaceae bacterium]|nr:adenylyltransferase/cytidyltransferase family protein [Muribaculaceae bacterium]
MKKVITYGTYDLLHYGHIKLLERAKALGDYLIVGVTADDFDRNRGKINVRQSLMERIEAVRRTGLADEIIVEEYEGQKIDDIKRYGIDIFTVGSDWVGKFDYLGEYCEVVYLDRTKGVSSTEIRSKENELKIGIIGESSIIAKFVRESEYVNGVKVVGICSEGKVVDEETGKKLALITNDYDLLLGAVDAMYVISHPSRHYADVKKALEHGKHVLCESPVSMSAAGTEELYALAKSKRLALVDGLKTAYSLAYARMILLAKGGVIGDIVSVDSVCTSLREVDYADAEALRRTWNSITSWGPTALLPVFQLLGTEYADFQIYSRVAETEGGFDEFSKVTFVYPSAVASIKVGIGVKSEGQLIISGTKGYIYVPAPWWKTDYFEVRYENQEHNRRYFYNLEGEGIRYEIVSFLRIIENKGFDPISKSVSEAISGVMEAYDAGRNLVLLQR